MESVQRDPRVSSYGRIFLKYVTEYFDAHPPDTSEPQTTFRMQNIEAAPTMRSLEATQTYLLNLPGTLSEVVFWMSPTESATDAARRVRAVAHSVVGALYGTLLQDCQRVLAVAGEKYATRCGWSGMMYELMVCKVFFPLVPLGRKLELNKILAEYMEQEPENLYLRLLEFVYPDSERETSEARGNVREWEVIIYLAALATLGYAASTARQAASLYDSERVDQRLIRGDLFRVLAAAVGGPGPQAELEYVWEGDAKLSESSSDTLLRLQGAEFAIPPCMFRTIVDDIVGEDK